MSSRPNPGTRLPRHSTERRRARSRLGPAALAFALALTASLALPAPGRAVVSPGDEAISLEIPRPTVRLAPSRYASTPEARRLEALSRRGELPVRSEGRGRDVVLEDDEIGGKVAARAAVARAAWGGFRERVDPGARAVWNERTGAPHRVRTARLTVDGGPFVTRSEAEHAARRLLAAHSDLFTAGERPGPVEMPLVKSRRVGEVWFLVFGQRHRGLEVVDGRVDVRLRVDGRVPVIGSEWFPAVSLPDETPIHRSVAEAAARTALGPEARPDASRAPDRALLPVAVGERLAYRLVHRVHHETLEPRGRWTSYVDAADGTIWARENEIRHFDLDGTVTGFILPATPTDAFVERPFRHAVVRRAGDSTFTALDGTYLLPGVTAGETIQSGLRSPFMEARNQAAPTTALEQSAPGSGPLDFLWEVATSDTSERNAFWHGLLSHDYMKALNPGFTAIDYRMPCNVNINSACNAFWDGNSINFFRWGFSNTGTPCANTGNIADVVYHEYGHGVTQFTFAPFAPNGAMHEGFSDYLAATMTRQPEIGRGFFGPGTNIRTADNTVQIDEASCEGQVHCVGRAVAGALWDMQGNLAAALGDSGAAQVKADSLWHLAGFGGAFWYDDYFLDLLVVADDDGTLLNGTPFWGEICSAFEGHGFECPDTTSGAWVVHAPLPDADPSASPFDVSAEMGSFAAALAAGEQRVHFRVNGGPWQESALSAAGGDTYEGQIPALPNGGSVDYWLENGDTQGSTGTSPDGAPAVFHNFHVGTLDTLFADDFESDLGWTASSDQAETGFWTRTDPNGTVDNGFQFQPEDDHTADPGVQCYVTADTTAGLPVGVYDVDAGCVILTSPRIDLSGALNARLTYWRWFTNGGSRLDDSLYVDLSADDGQTWTRLELQERTENFWRERSFDLGSRIPLTDSVRLRVLTCDTGGGSLTEAALDDVVITRRVFQTVAVGDPGPGSGGALSLAQSLPNPTVGGAAIRFTLPGAAAARTPVRLRLYDARGRLVRTLLSEKLAPGSYTVEWDGTDDAGRRVAAGAYVYRLEAGAERRTRKLVVAP